MAQPDDQPIPNANAEENDLRQQIIDAGASISLIECTGAERDEWKVTIVRTDGLQTETVIRKSKLSALKDAVKLAQSKNPPRAVRVATDA